MIPAYRIPAVEQAFCAYTRWYLRRHFHTVHLNGRLEWLRSDPELPLLVCVSHSSWWDLLLCLHLNELVGGRESYAPMDERQLRRYRFFTAMGIYGVERTSLHGAREFVDYSASLLANPGRALWMTPQGEFTSNAARPVRFQPGIGYVAERLPRFCVTSVALDYEFWSENRPEAFISLEPAQVVETGAGFDRRAFVHDLERRMERHLDAVAALRVARDPSLFTPVLSGRRGISTLFDAGRRIGARLRGETALLGHEEVQSPRWRDGGA